MFELGKAANIEIAKFVHAEQEAFVVRNRRNRRLGIWLASQLRVIEDELDFVNTVVALGVAARDDESLIRHIEGELVRRGLQEV